MSLTDIGIWIIALGIAIACALAYLRGDRTTALGAIIVAAAFSSVTAKIGTAGVRLEQPAIVLLALLVATREPGRVWALVRKAWLPIALIVAYLGANVASALLSAPDVLQSLKLTLWLAISLTGGLIAAVLIAGPDRRAADAFPTWIVGAAVVQTVVAAIQVLAEVLLHSTWGVLPYDAPLGKASGLAWEPNLLSIYLAVAMIFVLIQPLGVNSESRRRWAAVVILGLGMALALSRGGIVALAAGLLVALAMIGRSPGRRRTLGRLALPAVVALAIPILGYATLSWLGDNGVGLAQHQIAGVNGGPIATLQPVSRGLAVGSNNPGQTANPDKQPTASGQIVVSDDTVGLRVRNALTAWQDAIRSPLLGLGPDTFGQRYLEPSCACPAHIPNQLSATFYETGLIGLLSLVAVFSLAVVGSARAGRPDVAIALIVLAVGYQFTDAVRFATLWLVIGIAVGEMVLHGGSGRSIIAARDGTPPSSPRHPLPM